MELGFWIPIVSGIADCTSKNFPDSEYHMQKFAGFLKSEFPYHVVSFAAVIGFVTQRSGGALGDDPMTAAKETTYHADHGANF